MEQLEQILIDSVVMLMDPMIVSEDVVSIPYLKAMPGKTDSIFDYTLNVENESVPIEKLSVFATYVQEQMQDAELYGINMADMIDKCLLKECHNKIIRTFIEEMNKSGDRQYKDSLRWYFK